MKHMALGDQENCTDHLSLGREHTRFLKLIRQPHSFKTKGIQIPLKISLPPNSNAKSPPTTLANAQLIGMLNRPHCPACSCGSSGLNKINTRWRPQAGSSQGSSRNTLQDMLVSIGFIAQRLLQKILEVARMLDQKWSNQDMNWHSYKMLLPQAQGWAAMPPHQPYKFPKVPSGVSFLMGCGPIQQHSM